VISPLILKQIVLVSKKPFAVLFNLSLLSGVFPCVWKESYFVPLFKSGDKRNISNYRGISILSAIPKLFEKLVCDVITQIIRPSISESIEEQHGFVGGRFTVTSLVEFSNFVLSEMENGLQVDAVYTDFSKAFDRVNHGLLLGTLTLKLCGSMILWMGSYLTGRTQRVRVGNYLSETIYCHSRVPQGSHLGPLFFIADINDVLGIFENVGVLAYASRCYLKLYMHVSNTDVCRFFQLDLNHLQGWKYDLNAGKCKSISVGRNR
jgi:hypothetical protein